MHFYGCFFKWLKPDIFYLNVADVTCICWKNRIQKLKLQRITKWLNENVLEIILELLLVFRVDFPLLTIVFHISFTIIQ